MLTLTGDDAMNLTREEEATILAALRWYQETPQDKIPLRIVDIATDCGALIALGDGAIDDLCERLNFDAVSGR
jgi:hypothetical protein